MPLVAKVVVRTVGNTLWHHYGSAHVDVRCTYKQSMIEPVQAKMFALISTAMPSAMPSAMASGRWNSPNGSIAFRRFVSWNLVFNFASWL